MSLQRGYSCIRRSSRPFRSSLCVNFVLFLSVGGLLTLAFSTAAADAMHPEVDAGEPTTGVLKTPLVHCVSQTACPSRVQANSSDKGKSIWFVNSVY